MIVKKTDVFAKWLRKLRDRQGVAIILNHIDRIENGNIGKVESVGDGVLEKKIDYGPGYRLYFCYLEETMIMLLCGGDKSSQHEDIQNAKEIRRRLR